MPAGAGHWDLAVRQPLRWGVAGCGKLAEDFAGVLSTVPGATLAAAAEEYDAVYRALPGKNMANGVLPHDGLSSLQRSQVRAAQIVHLTECCKSLSYMRRVRCAACTARKLNLLSASCCTGICNKARHRQSLWYLC